MCITIYLIINLIFATIYFFLGPEELGINQSLSCGHKFLDCFFFSAQTITSVGYGRINPSSIATNTIASLESLLGLMSFAVLTGLIYSRFSKPKAFIKFSKQAIIAPYKDGLALMFRLASFKNNNLTDLEAQVLVTIHTLKNDKWTLDYINLPLEIKNIQSLALNWTLVHPINEDSPLFGLTEKEFELKEIEILIFINAFDEHFSNIVKQRTSYSHHEIVFNAKFKSMFTTNETYTTLHLNKLSEIEKI
jgi:inward rectifier potassium channel